MNVRNNGHHNAFGTQAVADLPDMWHVLQPGNGNAYHPGSGSDHPAALLQCSFNIVRVGIAHGLDDYLSSAAYHDGSASYAYFFGNESHCCSGVP